MADLITTCPPTLASLKPYLLRASQFEKGLGTDPRFGKLAYYLRYAAAQQGVKVIDGLSGPAAQQGNGFLMQLLDRLSVDKTNYAINSAEETSDLAFITNYAGGLFKRADDSDRAGAADTGVGQSFATAGFLFDVVRSLSPEAADGAGDPRLAQAAKYAKGRATDILTALKAGQMPPPPAGGATDGASLFAELGFDLPPAPAVGPAGLSHGQIGHAGAGSFASSSISSSEPMQGVSHAAIAAPPAAAPAQVVSPGAAGSYGIGLPIGPPQQPSASPTFSSSSSSSLSGPNPSSAWAGLGQAVSGAVNYAQNQLASVAASAATIIAPPTVAAPPNLAPSPAWAKLGAPKGGAGLAAAATTPLPAGRHGVSSAVLGDCMELTKHAMAALKEDDPQAAATFLRQALGLLPAQH